MAWATKPRREVYSGAACSSQRGGGAHKVGLCDGLCAATGGCEVGARIKRLAAVPAAAEQAAAAACIVHLVLLPSVHLRVH